MAASFEDLIKLGYVQPDDLSEGAKGEIAMRSPGLKPLLEGNVEPPKKQNISEQLIMD